MRLTKDFQVITATSLLRGRGVPASFLKGGKRLVPCFSGERIGVFSTYLCNREIRLRCLEWDVEEADKNFFVLMCLAMVWIS